MRAHDAQARGKPATIEKIVNLDSARRSKWIKNGTNTALRVACFFLQSRMF